MDIFSAIVVESISSQVHNSLINVFDKAVIIACHILDSHVCSASGKVCVILVILGIEEEITFSDVVILFLS